MRKSRTFLVATGLALTIAASPALAQGNQHTTGDLGTGTMGNDHGQGMMNDGDHGQGMTGNGNHRMMDNAHNMSGHDGQ